MAALELPGMQSSTFNSDVKEDCSQTYIAKATELLLFKQFKECIEICDAGIAYTKIQDDARTTQTVESLCVLAIQAYAELNCWQEVLPFVQSIYKSIECCPYKVIQICLLLHAKVQEYPQCHAISSIWLRHPDNTSHPEYKDLVTTYIHYVLIPQNKTDIIPQYLDGCPGLKPSEKEQIISMFKQKSDLACDNKDSVDSGETVEADKDGKGDETKNKVTGSDFWITRLAQQVHNILDNYGLLSVFNLKSVIKFAAVAVCLSFVTVRVTKGYPLLDVGHATLFWQGAFKYFKTLFGPSDNQNKLQVNDLLWWF